MKQEAQFEKPVSPTFEKVWFCRLGAWRTDLLTRGLGFMLYLACIGHWGKASIPHYLQRFPLASPLLGICGVALMLSGPRLIILLPTFLSSAHFIWLVLHGIAGSGLRQQAAEYPIMMLVPGYLALLAISLFIARRRVECGWRRFNEDYEQNAVLIFRWLALTTLFFAGFHKLNSDFFTPSVSCEQVVKQYALRNWSLPGLESALGMTSPLLIVVLESVAPIVLLLQCRRVGVVVVTTFFGGIALTDALVVTLCIILPSLAFLEMEDWEALRKGWKKMAFGVLAILVVWLPMSAAQYRGSRPWLQPALYQCILISTLAAMIFLCLKDLAAALKRMRVQPCKSVLKDSLNAFGWGRPVMFHWAWPDGGILAAWIAILFLNGLSPYLGIKFNYSFAMLSNLRVDDARWNHFIVPKWVRLTPYDGYVHVLFAEVRAEEARLLAPKVRGLRLKPGLFSPQAIHEILNQLQREEGEVELKLLVEYKGKALDYSGFVTEPAFDLFRAQLPAPNGHWLHDYLAADGPMGCKH